MREAVANSDSTLVRGPSASDRNHEVARASSAGAVGRSRGTRPRGRAYLAEAERAAGEVIQRLRAPASRTSSARTTGPANGAPRIEVQSHDDDEVIRRALTLNPAQKGSDRVEVNDLRPWQLGLETYLPVGSGQDRCHIISFEQLRLGVWQALIEYLYDGKPTGNFPAFSAAIGRLRGAAFPNGPKASTHAHRPTAKQLDSIAAKLHQEITNQLAVIQKATSEAAIVAAADAIVLCLNSSPDNLRPADKTTNQSIGAALDPRGHEVKPAPHLGGGAVQITGTTAQQLLALNPQERQRLIELYSGPGQIQNSETPALTADKMKPGNPTVYLNGGKGSKLQTLF